MNSVKQTVPLKFLAVNKRKSIVPACSSACVNVSSSVPCMYADGWMVHR